jgi:hypothetical protein
MMRKEMKEKNYIPFGDEGYGGLFEKVIIDGWPGVRSKDLMEKQIISFGDAGSTGLSLDTDNGFSPLHTTQYNWIGEAM